MRAHGLEKYLKTPAKIYYQCEDLPPAGTFKMNASLPQAYWAMKEGCKRVVFGGGFSTRTKFLHAFSAKMFGLTPTLYLPRGLCSQNKEQIFFIEKMLEIDFSKSPSNRTNIGRKFLKENPNHPGSGAIAGAEVVEDAMSDDVAIIISSKLSHFLLAQTIIGLEVKKQLESIEEKPNVLIVSVGGGSSFHGLIAPYMKDYLNKQIDDIKFVAVESETCSKLTNGEYKYTSLQTIPTPGMQVKTYEFKWETPPSPIIGCGLQAKDVSPVTSLLRKLGMIDTRVYPKDEVAIYEAAKIFLQTEGRLVAPESAYSVRGAIDEALEAKKTKEEKTIVTCVSGTTYLDFNEKQKYTNF